MGEPDKDTAAKLVAEVRRRCSRTKSDDVNRELVQLLVYLKSPTIVEKVCAELKKPSKPLTQAGLDELLLRNRGYGGTIANMLKNAPDQQKLRYLFTLRNATVGWNMDRWKVYYALPRRGADQERRRELPGLPQQHREGRVRQRDRRRPPRDRGRRAAAAVQAEGAAQAHRARARTGRPRTSSGWKRSSRAAGTSRTASGRSPRRGASSATASAATAARPGRTCRRSRGGSA